MELSERLTILTEMQGICPDIIKNTRRLVLAEAISKSLKETMNDDPIHSKEFLREYRNIKKRYARHLGTIRIPLNVVDEHALSCIKILNRDSLKEPFVELKAAQRGFDLVHFKT